MLNPISRFFGLLGRLFQSGADRIEDPSYVLERAFSQQQQALEETRRGRLELETISARLDIESRQLADGVGACEEQARRALTAGREDLARISLARREELDDQLARTQSEREHLEEERRTLQRQESELAGAVQAFRSRKEVLKAQYGATQARLRVGEALTGYSRTVTTVGDDVRRFEDRLLTLQARTRALETVAIGPVAGSVMAPSYVDRELKMIGASPRIQEAVERLRTELGLPSPQRHVQPAAVEAAHIEVPQLEAANANDSQREAPPAHSPRAEATHAEAPRLEAAS
ncbi:MAG: PspA/IM30 family protein [Chloroflexota bacterium]